MGSIQQVTMGAICLVAAFAFGSFINRQPAESSDSAPIAEAATEGVRSLIEPDLVVEKRPAKTPWVKPKLAARLPMPSLPETADVGGQSNLAIDDSQFGSSNFADANPVGRGDIPPPSDLTGRIGNTGANDVAAGPVIEAAPDFSGGLNAVSSMPVVSDRRSGRSPNLVDQFKTQDDSGASKSIVEKAPMFGGSAVALAQEKSPSEIETKLNVGNESGSRWGLSPEKSAMAPIGGGRPETLVATPRSLKREPAKFVNLQPGEGESQSVLNSNRSTGLVPLPSLEQESVAATSIEIIDPAAAFRGPTVGEEPVLAADSDSRLGQSSSLQMGALDTGSAAPTAVLRKETAGVETQFAPSNTRRVARLPFTLNSNARTRLTRLRDETIEKISLSTTKFTDHVVENGESLQAIATRYFGKPDFYLDIYMANRDRLKFPGDIRDGMIIKVPVYQ